MAGLVPFNKRKSDFMNVGIDDFYGMLDDFFTEGWPFRKNLTVGSFKVDIQEDGKNYFVAAELPGVKKEELSIAMDEGKLRISVTRDENTEEENKNYVHRERRYCSMHRDILLADANAAGIKAKLDNGILSITVPKKEKQDNSVKIEIE
jgi:HSP20 family protein